MGTPEEDISEFVTTFDPNKIPDETVETVERAFFDTIGVILAGSVEGAGKRVLKANNIDINNAGTSTLLGIKGPEPADSAALRIGTASHALDYDDLSWAMDGHPSVTLVPTLLVLANEVNASGVELITAYTVGFEVECALATPISPEHYESGWHATSTFGVFGAAAAAAYLLNFDAADTKRALNIAASMPAGIKRNFGSMTKPLHAGLCSRSGVTAVHLVQNGFTAGHDAISGKQGFWDLYSPKTSRDFSIGDRLAIVEEGIHIKAYPCCYFTHTSISATQTLLSGEIDPRDVERIEVEAAGGARDALTHSDPDTGLEAKFSMEHAVAVAALRDRVDLSAFEDTAVHDPDIEQFRKRVDFSTNENFEYDSHEAIVRIVTADKTKERHQRNPPGTYNTPLSEDELRAKFEECANRALPAEEVERLANNLLSLSTLSNVATTLAE